jgi:hypothetical protein
MTTPSVQIAVICDDPHHARGKVAKIATITVYDDGTWSTGEQQAHQGRRLDRAQRKAESGRVRDADKFMSTIFGGTLRCKLCGRHLPLGVAFGRVVRQIAAAQIEGESVVNLARLGAMMRREGP